MDTSPPMDLGKSIATACSSFAVTNIDNLFVLVTFFADAASQQGQKKITPCHITIGQYAGFTVLIVISMVGLGLSCVVSSEPIGFMGFLPMLLGIWRLLGVVVFARLCQRARSAWRVEKKQDHEKNEKTNENDKTEKNGDEKNDNNDTAAVTAAANDQDQDNTGPIGLSTLPTLPTMPILSLPLFEDPEPTLPPLPRRERAAIAAKSVVKVALVTLMGGGDNISTYIPLFSQARGSEIAVYVVVYYIMLGLWCFAAFLAMRQRHVVRVAQRYARPLVPLLYIGLGIYIVVRSHCYPWLMQRMDAEADKPHHGRVAHWPEIVLSVVTVAVLLLCMGVMAWVRVRQMRKKTEQAEAEQSEQGEENEADEADEAGPAGRAEPLDEAGHSRTLGTSTDDETVVGVLTQTEPEDNRRTQ